MTKYIIVEDEDVNLFTKIVEIKINEGFVLVGGASSKNGLYIQALTKEVDNKLYD